MTMIPFSPPRLDEQSIAAVSEVILSGWITTGSKTKQFEQQLAQYTGCKKTLCLGSATAAMELVLRWFGVGYGDEVIIPAYTYCATANVVLHCGAKPIMVDIEPNGFNIHVDAVQQAITANTKVIIPVDIAGWPCDYDELLELVAQRQNEFKPTNDVQKALGRILLLADAAHGLGAIYKSKMHGSIADATVFSFHAVKNLTTAEGGAVCLNMDTIDCEKTYQALSVKSLHGQTKNALVKSNSVGSWRYDVIEPGYKCNMTDIQAAIGVVELERYNQTLARRREIVYYYLKFFKDKDWAICPVVESVEKTSSYHLFLLRIKAITEVERDAIIQRIFAKDVSTNVHFQPLPLLTAYKNLGYRMNDYPNAYATYINEITLPVYYHLTDENLKQIVAAVSSSVEEIIR